MCESQVTFRFEKYEIKSSGFNATYEKVRNFPKFDEEPFLFGVITKLCVRIEDQLSPYVHMVVSDSHWTYYSDVHIGGYYPALMLRYCYIKLTRTLL